MINIENTLSKIEEKKQIKKENLLSSAYNLFIKKGINDTSISDIVNEAGVAKGTFYLYFKDKWEIHEAVIIEKSKKLFNEAIDKTTKKNLKSFPDKLISIIDYIIDVLSNNKDLIKLINKNLSLGLYNKNIIKIIDEEYKDLKDKFIDEITKYSKNIKNPNVTLFMIIELVGSTCYNSILNNEPLPINKFKPYLYDEIKKMIN
ncbi:MAG: TetR/AcrR family transcriptional regulator [Clostridium sp.]|nr:TetR/AcrR family transcriptional regulator [Clostridium sp.]